MSNTLTTRRSRFEELWNQDKSKTASDFERQYKVALQQLSGSEKFKQMWNATPEPNGSTSFERNYNKALDATSPQRTFEEMWNESPDEFDRLWQEQQSTVKQQKTD
ncbi:MAG: hypothetical protein C0507_08495, partial [Cyanobacteria bacterium PR.3.49]|nr:hypothetical protein [Cyanobacteria bacterium PR.3.49]